MTQLLDSPSVMSLPTIVVNSYHAAESAEETAAPPLPSAPPTDSTIEPIAELFKLIADETRLRILALLAENVEMHVRALCNALGQSQPAVSHHLALLRVAGVIECRRDGKHNFYRAAADRAHGLLDLIFKEIPAIRRRIRPLAHAEFGA